MSIYTTNTEARTFQNNSNIATPKYEIPGVINKNQWPICSGKIGPGLRNPRFHFLTQPLIHLFLDPADRFDTELYRFGEEALTHVKIQRGPWQSRQFTNRWQSQYTHGIYSLVVYPMHA
jgi:hypothetical protein